MDHRLTPQQEDELIEDALLTYPLVAMPRDITANVLTRIKQDSRPSVVTWDDAVISLVIVLCIVALFFTIQSLPPILVMQIRKQGILLYQHVLINVRWLVPSALFGLAAFFSALTIPYLRNELTK